MRCRARHAARGNDHGGTGGRAALARVAVTDSAWTTKGDPWSRRTRTRILQRIQRRIQKTPVPGRRDRTGESAAPGGPGTGGPAGSGPGWMTSPDDFTPQPHDPATGQLPPWQVPKPELRPDLFGDPAAAGPPPGAGGKQGEEKQDAGRRARLPVLVKCPARLGPGAGTWNRAGTGDRPLRARTRAGSGGTQEALATPYRRRRPRRYCPAGGHHHRHRGQQRSGGRLRAGLFQR